MAGQGLKVYSQEYYCERSKEKMQEIIFEPQNEQGQDILEFLFPSNRKHPSGVTRKEFLDKWGRPDPKAGCYVRVKPYGLVDKRVNNGTVSEDQAED